MGDPITIDYEGGPTLNQVLDQLEYDREIVGRIGRKSVSKNGKACFGGLAYEIWDWLEATGQIVIVNRPDGEVTRLDHGTHDADDCPRVFGSVCAHPVCARRDREIAAFKREMGAL